MKGSAFADIMMRVKLVESATFVYHENLEGEVKWGERDRPASSAAQCPLTGPTAPLCGGSALQSYTALYIFH